ncbi:hypothetical protein NA57DRAFT_41718 [Rhizodiscina lignyota]|uniref:HSF-type DNA-binding domain-containing protein n=1 Tax=Rhizodiscina lignyota TaxID=1504668 RepID=A0A9P4IEH1_9PEZI|nr:hypothetical protein NA57DRAFT_41718 [Rhizodiscina lignyota]
MTSIEPMRRSPFSADPHAPNIHKSIPILPSTAAPSLAPGDPMDITPPSSVAMGPPAQGAPGADRSGPSASGSSESEPPTTNGSSAPAVGAAAAAQQPKVVQTAFIHKLYNMLEDQSIQHLISWSSTNESFVMSPSSEFSKVLSSYFKHTNISSFVRQLNMYGFHKVSDVFHTGAPDSPLWEFKHGNGNFKRGDLVGLREIKRRASRHALIHRDSFSAGPKTTVQPPGTPVEPVPDPVEARLSMLEHSLYDVHVRLGRSEDSSAYLNSKCQALTEGLLRCHQWNNELTNHIMTMVPDPDNPIHRDVANMQRDISRQIEMLRSFEDSQESIPSARTTFFANLPNESGPPLSPRQMPHDEGRRSSLAGTNRLTPFRQPAASHLSVSPRRYGSIGGSSNYSPSSARAPAPPPPPAQPMQPPMVSVTSPPANLSRRHTSADIRLHGWQGPPGQSSQTQASPFASGHNSVPWPSSPHRTPLSGDQEIRNALAQYEIRGGPRQGGSRQPSPPQDPVPPSEAGWQLPGAKYPFRGIDASGPPTRRSSLASNVHSLLNPAETAERPEGEEEGGGGKRKRVQ